MPSFCTECGAPLSAGTRFCEQCGAATTPETTPYIPLLEFHEGLFRRTPAVMEVTGEALRVYRLPEYFSAEVEDLTNRLGDAYWDLPDNQDWRAIITTWNWKAERLITAVDESRTELEKDGRLLVISTKEITTVGIEHVESDTVYDIMTIDAGGEKQVFDLVGPVVWHAVSLLRTVLGEKVTYVE